VPSNPDLHAQSIVTSPDEGLKDNTGNAADAGKFKVPTLRNVAVTGPYMHNGVFKNLKTVIEFFDHFHGTSIHIKNPETGATWASPEVPIDSEDKSLLQVGNTMSDVDVDNMLCFLRTLTDKRYENLIQDNGYLWVTNILNCTYLFFYCYFLK
jgi:cytochrome c peroxidase